MAMVNSVVRKKGDSPFDDDDDDHDNDDDDDDDEHGAEFFSKSRSGRRGRFRQKILANGAILAIFEPFEVRKFRMPFFGEFGRSSQDLGESDYNSIKSRDDRMNSPKSGARIFQNFKWLKNREDGSDSDNFLTKSIATTQT